MRIISAAKRASEVVTSCNRCHSKLGISMSDLSMERGYFGYECPVCFERNYFASQNKEDIFPWIMESELNEEVQGDNSMRQHEV